MMRVEVVRLEVGMDEDTALVLSFDREDTSNPLPQFSDEHLLENEVDDN